MSDDRITELLSGLRVTIGVCGSISAVAVPHIALWLKGTLGVARIDLIVTGSAARLVGVPVLEASVDGRVFTGYTTASDNRVTHVTVAQRADILIVLPATANVLGKAAHGIADDLLTTTLLAAECPVVFVPVMNEVMWAKPAVRRNVAALREDGYEVVEPAEGLSLATGKREVGSMGDYRPVIVKALTRVLAETTSRTDEGGTTWRP